MGTTATIQAQVKPAIPYNAEIEAKVEATLAKMSLDEKIGQMCEITVDAITDFSDRSKWNLSEENLKKVLRQYKVGSILNVPLSMAQTPESWATGIRKLNQESMDETGIPQIYGVDQMHGTTYTYEPSSHKKSTKQLLSTAVFPIAYQKSQHMKAVLV